MVLLLPCALSMKAVKRNINAYHLFRKTTKTPRQDLLLTSLSSLFYGKGSLFNKYIHIISHFSTSN